MFEKEAEEFADCKKSFWKQGKTCIRSVIQAFQKGAEFGYNKGKEDVKHDLMMKLKDEGIVKPLKDSVLRNERLSSQEQQELCAWIECAMDFGENLDECAKELEEVNKANEWHFVKEKGFPKKSGRYWVYVGGGENGVYPLDFDTEANDFGYWCLNLGENLGVRDTIFETVTERKEDKVIAWKEIVLPQGGE